MMSYIGKETKETITNQFSQHVSSGKVEFYKQAGIDFVMGRREGIYIWDLDGKRLINSIPRLAPSPVKNSLVV